MIKYSLRSRRAVARLMRPYNDIDVYVEDKTFVGIYERVFNSALSGIAKITKIIPLGNCDAVVNAAIKDSERGGRPRLYIVDGDLNLISHARLKRATHLFRLNVYSLENVLFEKIAVERYCNFAIPDKSVKEAIELVNFDKIIGELDRFAPAYLSGLAIARRLKLGGPEFSIKVGVLFRKHLGKYVEFEPKAVRSKIHSIIREIKRVKGVVRYRKEKAMVMKIIKTRNLPGVSIFPGKSILWFLNERVGSVGGQSLNQKVMASYLADYCTLSMDPALKQKLLSVAAKRYVGASNPSSPPSPP